MSNLLFSSILNAFFIWELFNLCTSYVFNLISVINRSCLKATLAPHLCVVSISHPCRFLLMQICSCGKIWFLLQLIFVSYWILAINKLMYFFAIKETSTYKHTLFYFYQVQQCISYSTWICNLVVHGCGMELLMMQMKLYNW
jgi:hypothetical protein